MYAVQINPNGWIPAWVVNLIGGDEPVCIERIKKYLQTKKQNETK
jgi:hypothetical protein